MSACIDFRLSARVRVLECVRAHTRGSSARPLDVHPYVHECVCMHMCIDKMYRCRFGTHFSMRLRVRESARARRELRNRVSTTCVALRTYVDAYIYIYLIYKNL